MAFTLRRLMGFETDGLSELATISGSAAASASVRAGVHGNYCLTCPANSTQINILDVWEFQGSASSTAKGFGFWWKASATFAATIYIAEIRDTSSLLKCRITATPNFSGQLVFSNSAGTALATGNGIAQNAWHFIEAWFEDNSDSAAWEFRVDGNTIGSGTGASLRASQSQYVRLGNMGGGGYAVDFFFDDVYFADCTAASDLLGDLDIFAPVGDSGATETGDALDAGTLLNTQEIPGNDSNTAAFSPPAQNTPRLAPDTIATQTNLSGAVTDIDDDPDSPDANWLTASGSSTLRVTFPTPTDPPVDGAGLQNFRVLLRKNATGPSGSGGEDVLPDGLGGQDANLDGTAATIDDDPQAPGGDWRNASSNNSNSVSHALFATPSVAPTGTQTFEIYARLTANGTACTYNVYLYENGTALNGGAAIGTGSLTSTTGQLITATWNASLLGTADGSLVECVFEVVKSGGAPAARTTGEVDAMRWAAAYTVSETQPGYEIKLYENGSEVVAAGSATGNLTDAGGNTVVQFSWNSSVLATNDGSLVECYVNQTSGADRFIEVGAVEWNATTQAADATEQRYRRADSGPAAGPAGMSGIGTIIGSLIYTRARYTGSGSTLISRTRWGEVASLEAIDRTESASYTDTFLERTTGGVPEATDAAIIGWGRPVGTDVTVEAAELLHMVAHVPAGGITVTPNPVASAAVLQQPAISFGTATIQAPGPVASAAAVQQPAVALLLTVEAGTITSQAVVQQPAIDFSLQVQAPGPVASAAVVQDPAVALGVLTVQADPVASQAALQQPTIILEAVQVQPQPVASAAALQQPAVELAAVQVQPDPVASAAVVQQPAVELQTVLVDAQPVASAATVQQPAIDFSLQVLAQPVPSSAQVEQPTLALGTLTVQLLAIASPAVVEEPAVSVGEIFVEATAVPSQATLQQPAISLAPLTVEPQPVASQAAVEEPSISLVFTVQAQPVASSATIPDPALALGTLTVEPQPVASTATVEQPAVDVGGILVGLQPIASAAVVQQPAVELAPITVELQPVSSQAQLQQPAVELAAVVVEPQAIASQAQVQQPGLYLSLTIDPGTVSSAAVLQQPALGLDLQIQLQPVPSQAVVEQPALLPAAIQVDLAELASVAQVFTPAVAVGKLVEWHELWLTADLPNEPAVTAQLEGVSITAQLPPDIVLTK